MVEGPQLLLLIYACCFSRQ